MQKIFNFDIDILIVDWTSQDVADIRDTSVKYLWHPVMSVCDVRRKYLLLTKKQFFLDILNFVTVKRD